MKISSSINLVILIFTKHLYSTVVRIYNQSDKDVFFGDKFKPKTTIREVKNKKLTLVLDYIVSITQFKISQNSGKMQGSHRKHLITPQQLNT